MFIKASHKPVLDERHNDLEGVSQDRVTVVTLLDGFDENVGTSSLNGQAHGMLEHAIVETTLEHLVDDGFLTGVDWKSGNPLLGVSVDALG